MPLLWAGRKGPATYTRYFALGMHLSPALQSPFSFHLGCGYDARNKFLKNNKNKLKTRKAGGLDGLQPEHLKYGGALLTLWLKQIFNAFIHLEHIPPHILTGIIHPVYKEKGKDPFNCHSFRGITRTSVILKSLSIYSLKEYGLFSKLMVTPC